MESDSLFIPRPAERQTLAEVTPALAKWTYSGLKVVKFLPGESRDFVHDQNETVILPLIGGFTTTFSFPNELATIFETLGRKDSFSGSTDFMYIGTDVETYTLSTRDGCVLAFCSSVTNPTVEDTAAQDAKTGAKLHSTQPATKRADGTDLSAQDAKTTANKTEDPTVKNTNEELLTKYCPVGCAQTNIVGKGNATRTVTTYTLNNKVKPKNLIVIEETIPSGNWSAYPPTKHDTDTTFERPLEEINYFLFRPDEAEFGRAWHKAYTLKDVYEPNEPPGDIRFMREIRHGDSIAIPYGYNGPTVTMPGFDLYRLRVLAGPKTDSQYLETDDPNYVFVRRDWQASAPDPRVLPDTKQGQSETEDN